MKSSPVPRKEFTFGLRRAIVDAVGIGLRRVMFPELRPCVRLGGELRNQAQGRAVRRRRQDGARRTVEPDPDHILGTPDVTHRAQQAGRSLEPITGMLQRPIGRQALGPAGERAVDHAVRVWVRCRHNHAPVGRIDEHRARGFCAKIEADRVAAHSIGPRYAKTR